MLAFPLFFISTSFSSSLLFHPTDGCSSITMANKNNNGEKRKEEYKLTLRRAKSPTFLDVQVNASETGFKTIKTDRESERPP